MPINKNELVVRFEPDAQRLAIYRTIYRNGEASQLMFVTEFRVPELRSWPKAEAEQRIGRFLLWNFRELMDALRVGPGKKNED
jgi:hypothetical protein